MKSASCKAKGRRAVVELRASILASFPHLGEADITLVPTSVGGCDLKLSPLAQRCWPFDTELKNVEKLNVWSAIEQAKRNANGNPPCLTFKRNRTESWTAIPTTTMLRLLGGQPPQQAEDVGA